MSIAAADLPFFWPMYDSLLTHSPEDGSPAPQLAESWEISPDDLAYTLRLKRGVTFHDGTLFNAEATRYNFDRLMAPDTASPVAAGLVDMDRWEVIDEATFRVTLKQPYAPFLLSLDGGLGMVMSPTALEKLGKDITLQPVGTGPFRFEERVVGDHVTYTRYENYWDPTLPYLDKVTIRSVPDPTVMFTELRTGGADLVVNIPLDKVEGEKQKGEIRVVSFPHSTFIQLIFNCTNGVMQDERLRKAVSLAIDREALCKALYSGVGAPMDQLLTPLTWAHDDSLDGYRYDPQEARRLMEAAGVGDGFEFTMLAFNTLENDATAVATQLRDIGVKVTLRSLELGQAMAELMGGKFDVALFAEVSPADPHTYFSTYYDYESSRRANAYVRNEDPALLGLIKKAVRVTGREERKALYSQAQRILLDKVYQASLWQQGRARGMTWKVGGFVVWADRRNHVRDLWLMP
jgi:peptide/nickel transport system substrate-binding protein